MKTLCSSPRVLNTARKLAISLPICFLLQFYSYYNKANAGVVTYSSVVVVTNETKTKSIARLFPNLASKQISLAIAGTDNLDYTIIAIDRKIIKTGILLANKSQIEICAFAQGQYFVHLKSRQGELQVLRFVKK